MISFFYRLLDVYRLCSVAMMPSQLYGAVSVLAGLLLIINTSCLVAAANNGGQFSSLTLVGNVFCDTCFQQQFSEKSYFISGASVAVQCRIKKQQKPYFRIEAKTNEYGEFKVQLPPSIFQSHEQVKRCSAKLLKNPRGSCKVASMAKSSSFSLKSKQGGIYTYSAGSFTYRPPTLPALCSKDAFQTATLSSFKKAASFKASSVSGSSAKPSQLLPPLPSILPPLIPIPVPPLPSILPPLIPIPVPPLTSLIPPLPSILPPLIPIPVPPLTSLIPPLPEIPALPVPVPPLTSLIPPLPEIPALPVPVPPLSSLTPSLPTSPILPSPTIPTLPLPPNPLVPPPIPLIPVLPPPPLIPLPPVPFIPPAQHTLPATP